MYDISVRCYYSAAAIYARLGSIMICLFIAVITLTGCDLQEAPVPVLYVPPFDLGMKNYTGRDISFVTVHLEDGRTYTSNPLSASENNVDNVDELPIAILGRVRLDLFVKYKDGGSNRFPVVVNTKALCAIWLNISKDRVWVDKYMDSLPSEGRGYLWVWNEDDYVDLDLTFWNGRTESILSASRIPLRYKSDRDRHEVLRTTLKFPDGRKVSQDIRVNLERGEPFLLIIGKDKRVHLWRNSEIAKSTHK